MFGGAYCWHLKCSPGYSSWTALKMLATCSSNCCSLYTLIHGVIYWKTGMHISTAVTTSHLRYEWWFFLRTLLEENLYQKSVQFQDIRHGKISKCYKKKITEVNSTVTKSATVKCILITGLETALENFSQVHDSIKILTIQSWYVTVQRKYSTEGEK